MDVLQKLQNEVKRLDRQVKQSLDSGYDFRAANTRDLMEAAVKEIAHLRLHRDLAMSVIERHRGSTFGIEMPYGTLLALQEVEQRA